LYVEILSSAILFDTKLVSHLARPKFENKSYFTVYSPCQVNFPMFYFYNSEGGWRRVAERGGRVER
jgi:hypothetical protein